MRRRSGLKRKRGVRKVNPERRARLREVQYGSDEFMAWIHGQACVLCRYRYAADEIHAHHVVSRGAGGTWQSVVPLCHGCHRFVHDHGPAKARLATGVDLEQAAREIQARWVERVAGPEQADAA